MDPTYERVISILDRLPNIILSTMAHKNQSWREAAKDCDVSHTHLYKIAKGKTKPTSSHIVKILTWAGKE